jgi:XTP/dITP diphosphohydrolase
MKRTLVLGTGNRHKLGEIEPLLTGLDLTLKAAGDYGPFNPVEDAPTLEANAIIKAEAALKLSGEWSFADDTGLEVDAIGGRPGVHAARYAGPECNPAKNIDKLLDELQGVPREKRTARFVCVIAFCRPGIPPQTFRGTCPGHILTARRGTSGFGYDPVFLVNGLEKSFAEMSMDEKNRLSHRACAVKLFRTELVKLVLDHLTPRERNA